jgi:radical SAM protein with 4Fe4S-binding SPASM domain
MPRPLSSPQSLPGRVAVPDFESAPLLVLWEVTRACALACSHCRAEASLFRDPGELDTREALQLLDEMHGMGVPLVVLTGGDPLSREDIETLISHGEGLGMRMTMTPSVTPKLTPEALARLQQAGLCRLAVSLDSADPAVHDGMRGVERTFDRTLEVMRTARSLGLGLQVNTTVTRATLPTLHRMPLLLEEFGIELWSVFFLVPVGRGNLDLVPDAAEQEAAFEILHQAARTASFPVKATEAPHYRRFALLKPGREGLPPMAGVNDGKGVLFVDHLGEVFPSGFLPLSAGNVRRQDLRDIYRNSELFRRLRDPDALGGKCGRCEFRKLCGGSRARAYAFSGDPLGPEPCCEYQPGQAAASRRGAEGGQ